MQQVKQAVWQSTQRAGAIGWALLVWLLTGSLGIAVLIFILLKLL